VATAPRTGDDSASSHITVKRRPLVFLALILPDWHYSGMSPAFIVVMLFALAISYILRTCLGERFKAVRGSHEKALLLGVEVNGVRIKAMILSTVIACCGQLFFLQNIGMLNVYTAHLNTGVFASAALLAGGATIRTAGVPHVFLGVLLFHALFIVSPQAGQNISGNAALGEYFRSFVAYGTIAFARMMNIRQDKGK